MSSLNYVNYTCLLWSGRKMAVINFRTVKYNMVAGQMMHVLARGFSCTFLHGSHPIGSASRHNCNMCYAKYMFGSGSSHRRFSGMCHVWAAVKQNRSTSTSIGRMSSRKAALKANRWIIFKDRWAHACLDLFTVCHPWSMFTHSPVGSVSHTHTHTRSYASAPQAGLRLTCHWWGRNTGSNDSSPENFQVLRGCGGVKERKTEEEGRI